ncbi:threonine synthase [Brachyspira hyodysenteriae]|uniref:Threonine synthase n=2 Tax=Brachyspira hyodysenteriae TaxID=159 RepID=A0A3B6VAG7_BRAHW|nr:threonine synthase [Brachyspira hyodysenteriae]ACN83107.1 threonine synthase [Brachyspira hyodysenteriae WA1]ANN64773.1 threonine synthase [Brachyspira hyodysenteriae ATCC 27164]AUJ48851.1 threonine synthase [Brachyspira hyodysenteriae]KLI20372.1 threonine synthase [Brachyspira hyodysenteriae]KLI23302.1 threonine synthase [Brachyspira hyodysenteriae]
MKSWKGLLREYRKYLPITNKTPLITLHEGNTPLIKAERIGRDLDIELYLKYDGLNPTGSFKDRGMVMAVAKALEGRDTKAIMCASTGNTSASAAAYAARSGIDCIVVIPDGNIALGKLAQALMYGAKVIAIKGNFDEALKAVVDITNKYPITLVNSINPFRLQGQKTSAFEICDVLGKAPDYLAIPVGNAGNISAYWMGFKEYKENAKINNLPKMIGFEAEGSAAIVQNKIIENPQTLATAIKIGNPASWKLAVNAANESEGFIDSVTDDEILEAYKMLTTEEGVFAEPASAASLAGIIKSRKAGKINKGDTVVSVLTGNGLKDPDNAIKICNEPIKVDNNIEEIRKAIGI